MEKSLAELTQEVESLEANINTLTEEQKAFIELWCAAVGRIYEVSDRASYDPYFQDLPAILGVNFAKLCLHQSQAKELSETSKRYYSEEKIEMLSKIKNQGETVLEKYQAMLTDLRSFVNKEAQNTLAWDEWDGEYAFRKAAKWVREWKQRFLSDLG